jgi:cathepsin A (carboxypeptidase C)
MYLTGFSYAGHYVPAIGAHLLKMKNKDIKLKGIAIGNGLTSSYY